VSKTTEVALKGGDLRALVDRAHEGDRTALPALREALKDPAVVDRWGDLPRHTQQHLVAQAGGGSLLYRESLPRKLELLRAELAGANPTPVERLLVERVLTCWLFLTGLEAGYVSLRGRPEGIPLAQDAHYERCMASAQTRYLAAIKTLAVVRKLAVPVLQVNIARRQVNVAGPCVAGGSEEATA
jgi:hypothetical protein